MQANISNILASTVVPTAVGVSSDLLSVFAAGAISGAGATIAAHEIRGRLAKYLASSSPSHLDPLFGKPLTRAEVREHFLEGTWQRNAFDDYSGVLLDKDRIFPCVYASMGYKSDDQLYVFIDSDDLSEERHISHLAKALSVYLPQAHDLGPNTSLVLLAKENPTPQSMDEYNDGFWKLLDGLARLDTTPWPEHTPRDIDNDRWCFCFGGEQFFSVIQTPAHMNRASRYAKGVTIVFQPKWIFDILFSTEAKRAGALAKVRGLLKKYDPVPVSPELKNYGDEGSRESKQYFLLDENVPATCPYAMLGAGGEKPSGHP